MALVAALLALAPACRVDAQSSASPFTSATRYDAMHRVVGTIAPEPNGDAPFGYFAVRNSYDAAGNLAKVETGLLSSWQPDTVAPANWNTFALYTQLDMTYDLLGHKLHESFWSGGQTRTATDYKYDALERLVCTAVRMNPGAFGSVIDGCTLGPEGADGPDRITRTYYDGAGRVIQIQKAYGTPLQQNYATYLYRASGQLSSIIDANGALAQMGYDMLDRQIYWFFPRKDSIGQFDPTDYEQYDYDNNGNRTMVRKRDGRVISFGYDQLNRMTSKVVADGCAGASCPPASATRDVYYGYDLRGLQLYARFDGASGEGITPISTAWAVPHRARRRWAGSAERSATNMTMTATGRGSRIPTA